jgi:hypothetical protein
MIELEAQEYLKLYQISLNSMDLKFLKSKELNYY